MGLYDTIHVSKEAVQSLKITCPRCNTAPEKISYQSKSFGGAMGEYHIRVANGKVRLYKDTGDFWEGPSGETKICEPHGWAHLYGFCETCEEARGPRLYDVIICFSHGVAETCKITIEPNLDPIFGIIEENNELKE